jgi:hypothetical protein
VNCSLALTKRPYSIKRETNGSLTTVRAAAPHRTPLIRPLYTLLLLRILKPKSHTIDPPSNALIRYRLSTPPYPPSIFSAPGSHNISYFLLTYNSSSAHALLLHNSFNPSMISPTFDQLAMDPYSNASASKVGSLQNLTIKYSLKVLVQLMGASRTYAPT